MPRRQAGTGNDEQPQNERPIQAWEPHIGPARRIAFALRRITAAAQHARRVIMGNGRRNFAGLRIGQSRIALKWLVSVRLDLSDVVDL